MVINTKTGKTLSLSILVIIALIGTLLLYHHFFTRRKSTTQLIPDAIITGIELTKIDKAGKKNYKFLSQKAYYYQQQNRTDFTAPIGYYYAKNQPYWKLTADRGQALRGDQVIHLNGNVHLHQAAGKNNHEITLTTSKATIYPAKKIAENKAFVKVTEPGVVVTSVGFHANMKLGKVTLLSKVQGNFIPQNKPAAK